jgi:uncharacterized protein with HEPN domain
MTRDPRVYLAQILERAERIERYVGKGEEAFQQDTMIQDAVIRNFEVIGEAIKRLPDKYRSRHLRRVRFLPTERRGRKPL